MSGPTIHGQFAEDVRRGLMASPKYLSSRYFYDATGDALFRRIMELPEYYLTRSEVEILSSQGDAILEPIHYKETVHIVELGPGDGLKSALLLQKAIDRKWNFSYHPVDISPSSLDHLQAHLRQKLSSPFPIYPLAAEYSVGLRELERLPGTKWIVFLGSNIGNFSTAGLEEFFSLVGSMMHTGDYFLLGADLKKDPELILRAYNDASGITRAFNFNLLHRINRELGGNFDPMAFSHYPVYDPVSGEARSYLVSQQQQDVYIDALQATFSFARHEPVFMEVSRKFTVEGLVEAAAPAGLQLVLPYYDCKHYFADILMVKG